MTIPINIERTVLHPISRSEVRKRASVEVRVAVNFAVKHPIWVQVQDAVKSHVRLEIIDRLELT